MTKSRRSISLRVSDFDIRIVKIGTKNEIGQLARSFNKMTDDLRESRDKLVKVNEELQLDIIRRKQAERKLKKPREHLEELVEERTVTLKQEVTERKRAEEALLQRTEELAIVNRELESFTYSASHDLKEPLRGIETFSNFILEDYLDRLDDTGKDYLRRISAGAARMKKLIDDLLSLSRISRIKNPYETIEPKDIIKEATKRLGSIIKERDIRLSIADDLPLIWGDKIKVTTLFYNLISNAIKYNDKKEPAIEIDSPLSQSNDEVVISNSHFGIQWFVVTAFMRLFVPNSPAKAGYYEQYYHISVLKMRIAGW